MIDGAGQRRVPVLVCIILSLGPMGLAAVLPALPATVAAFGAGTGGVQISLGAYMVGLSLGQIVYGPVSDRIGRRPPLFAGIMIFIASNFAILIISSFQELLVVRFFHGFASAAIYILARSIVRDIYDREQAAKMYGIMLVTTGALTAASPMAGGWLTDHVGWQAIFLALGTHGIFVLVLVYIAQPETLAVKNPLATRLGPLLANAADIISHRVFLVFLALQLCVGGGLTVIIVGSPTAFMESLGHSSTEYAAIIGTIFGMSMIGGVVVNRLVVRVGMARVLIAGVTLMVLSGSAAVSLGLTNNMSLMAVAVPFAVFMLGLSLCSPNVQAGAMSSFPEKAGTASSVLGFIQQLSNAGVGFLLGATANGTGAPAMIGLGIFGACALVIFVIFVRPVVPRFGRTAEAR